MTFGEKLQSLRKQKNITQEQLALQLEVSRQAISKWELDSSLPDIENVLQLSKLLEVSTDYLLKDEIENVTDCSTSKTKDIDNTETPFVIGTCVMTIGLLMSFTGWKTYQTELAVSIGIAVQILGIAMFELLQSRYNTSDKSKLRRKFYTISSWLLTPFIVFFLSQRALGIYPKPYSHWTALLVPASIYLVTGTMLTLILRQKKN